MTHDREYWLDILRHNRGFADPEEWIAYARAHGFQKVKGHTLDACPSCATKHSDRIAQYVYYSTLLELRLCAKCGLAFSDTWIDPDLIREHFERSYKDHTYFSRDRRAIFRYLAKTAAISAPSSGRVIDIGGAQGHLLAELHSLRPDLDLTLSDLSETACDNAASTYGFHTICCAIPELANVRTNFHVIMLIDVLYYERDIRGVWNALAALACDSCCVLIRVPNRMPWLRCLQKLQFFLRLSSWYAQTSIPGFNPEHIYAFSRTFLENQLRHLHFDDVKFHPSPLLASGMLRFIASGYFWITRLFHRWSRGRCIATPSMIVVARRGATGGAEW